MAVKVLQIRGNLPINASFKASETLLGIETDLTIAVKLRHSASKPLKPF